MLNSMCQILACMYAYIALMHTIYPHANVCVCAFQDFLILICIYAHCYTSSYNNSPNLRTLMLTIHFQLQMVDCVCVYDH